MTNTMMTLYGAYRTDHAGDCPTAFRIHPEDWYRLLSECDPASGFLGPSERNCRKYMGMVALVDPKWRKGFPVCLSTAGAAEAIEAGARQA